MSSTPIHGAITSLEKSNTDLEPELLGADAVREQFDAYARAEKLVSYGKAMLARRLDDVGAVARATGTPVGKAKATVEAAKALSEADEVSDALRGGDISLDQASEIARAERARPGSAAELLELAAKESFQVL